MKNLKNGFPTVAARRANAIEAGNSLLNPEAYNSVTYRRLSRFQGIFPRKRFVKLVVGVKKERRILILVVTL